MESPILRSARAALANEPRIDLAHRAIALAFDDGVVTVEGVVPDVGAKKLALASIAATAGVHHIVDRLRASPARHMSDAEVLAHLRAALEAEPVFQGCSVSASPGMVPPARPERGPGGAGPGAGIEVGVRGGVVTLVGEVPSLVHKRLAGVLAWWVPGTADVVNGLEVVPPEEDSDEDLTDAVRIVLEKDPLVDAADVGVIVRGGVVTLIGAVPSPAQREMAEIDAWCVFAVDRVVNRLAVRPL